MKAYILDTNHVSAIFKQNSGIISRISASSDAQFGIGMPSVGEMWFMVLNSERISANTNHLEDILQDFRLWEYDLSAAREFGQVKTELRRAGQPIPDVDAQIAAIARLNGLTLLTSDRHFAGVRHLLVEDWLGP